MTDLKILKIFVVTLFLSACASETYMGTATGDPILRDGAGIREPNEVEGTLNIFATAIHQSSVLPTQLLSWLMPTRANAQAKNGNVCLLGIELSGEVDDPRITLPFTPATFELGPEETQLGSFRVPAGDYTEIHLEFDEECETNNLSGVSTISNNRFVVSFEVLFSVESGEEVDVRLNVDPAKVLPSESESSQSAISGGRQSVR